MPRLLRAVETDVISFARRTRGSFRNNRKNVDTCKTRAVTHSPPCERSQTWTKAYHLQVPTQQTKHDASEGYKRGWLTSAARTSPPAAVEGAPGSCNPLAGPGESRTHTQQQPEREIRPGRGSRACTTDTGPADPTHTVPTEASVTASHVSSQAQGSTTSDRKAW